MAELIDDGNNEEIYLTDAEIKRQTEDLNDDVFAGIFARLDNMLQYHRWAAIEKAVREADAEALREMIADRELQSRRMAFDLKQYIQNVLEAPNDE